MRKLIVLLVSLGGLVLFVAPAGAQSTLPSPVYSWGNPFPDTPTADSYTTGPGNGPTEYSDVTTTNSDTYVLDSSTGTVWAVGQNTKGELGNGKTSKSTSTTFTQVQFPDLPSTDEPPKIVSLASVGPDDTEMAIDSSGNVWGWGRNSFDQLCTTGEHDTPIEVTNLPAGDYTLASGGGDHASFYNSTNNTIYSCGENTDGELGDGKTDSSPSAKPKAVTAFDTSDSATVVAMTASWRNEGVIMSDGTYWNWGINTYDQLAQPSSVPYEDVPTEVTSFPAGYSVVQAAEGGGSNVDGSSMALLSDLSDPGAPYAYYGWGDDKQGQLCNSTTGNYDTPQPITIMVGGSPLSILSVAAGGDTGYVLTTAGALYGCGDNTRGQMGQGSKTKSDYKKPTQILTGDTITQISSTNWNTAALVTSSG
jgi:alpha-tubulin suppressor-like RCC1 family protein